jgi:DNA-binding NarL/FixJ family response regulator
MDSIRRDSTDPYVEIKPDLEGLLRRTVASMPHTDAEPGRAIRGTTIYQNAHECLTFENATERSENCACVGTLEKNRLSEVLWAREESISIVIVDGDAEARFLLQSILEQSGGYRCVGCYASGEEALRDIPAAHPRLVLMDVRLPGISGIECVRRLKMKLPGLIVVLVSELTDPETMSAALAAGGDGYLTKPFAVAQCLATVRFSVRPNRSAAPDNSEVKAASRGRVEYTRLTDREHHVMSCLEQGLLYKEIADELHLSFSVVHKLQHRIFLKLRVSNRTEAVTKWRNVIGG